MSVSYGGDSITFADGSVTSSGWTGFKNRIINGAITIDQRYSGSSANNIFGNIYVMDRWFFNGQVADKYTARMVTNANSALSYYESGAAPTGFTNSIKITTVSANTTVTNTLFGVFQAIEGNNITDLDWGLSTAKPVTISFWTKSSIAGAYSIAIVNNAVTRTYATTYTINQANTWEYKSVTIPGCTDGVWNKDNQNGMWLVFGLGGGTQYSVPTNNVWDTNTNKYHATGTTKPIETLGATWYVTGVQLEKGSTASSFEYRPYGTELALCQRYYWRGAAYLYGFNYDGGNVPKGDWCSFPVTMRVAPDMSLITLLSSSYTNSQGLAYIQNTGFIYYTNVTTNATYVSGHIVEARAEL